MNFLAELLCVTW